MFARAAVPLLFLSSLAVPAAAQQGGSYLRVAVGAARVEAPSERFSVDPVLQPSFALGYGWSGGRAVELRASWLDTESTERVPPGSPSPEAPSTIGTRAVSLGIGLQQRLPIGGERVYPFAGVGAAWTRVTDRWKSDTPEESLSTSVLGVDGSVGLVARLDGNVAVVARGGYRAMRDDDDRPPRNIGLSGAFADLGIQLGW